ncbi:HtaA domain-containing protein [Conyzicola nivalis]|uniref:HtaA domain-containing protein n=1 Tax=Conyzicola nivalis TaxID=1477021 RepID=UPI003395578E
MNTAVTSRLSRWAAAFIAAALVAGGSIIVTAPASAAPATVTGGSLDWGIAADYRAIFTTRGVAGGATQTAADTFAFPAATSSTYDPVTKTGTLNFTGNARIGYFAGPPAPGVASGNYFYISNPVVTITGDTGTIAGQTAGDSHSTNPELPKAPLANRTVATLDLSGVTPTVNAEGTLITLASVPTAITAEGAATLATFGSTGDAAAGKRVVGSALDPLTIQLAIVAQPVAAATTVALTAPASAVVGAPVALGATVTPANAAGSVEFFDGATSLGAAPVASGAASTSVPFAAAGAHSITARFVPADAALFAASTSAAAVVTVTAAPVVTTPTVVVSKTSVVDAGEIVTVTGAGFSPVGAATNAARPPLKDKFGGVYVSFGKFATVWKASAGATSAARPVAPGGKWVVNPADVATIGGAAAGGVAINADGTFSVQLLVKPGYDKEPATGNYGIYTYPGGGVAYPAFETYTPISFVSTPKVTVSKSTISSAGETVTVTGSGFSPVGAATNAARPPLAGKFGGVYVSFGKFATVWKASAGATSAARPVAPGGKWVVNPADVATIGGAAAGAVAINADGTFSVQLLVKPGYDKEPATGNYGIYTYPGGGVAYPAFETYTPVTFATAPVAVPTTTTLSAAPVAVTVGGSTTLTAQVTPPTAVGAVAFSLGSTPLGTVAVAGGAASLPVGGLAAGVQQFTATFVPGNTLDFTGSAGTASVTVAEKTVGAGSLTWGVKQSFRDYVAGPIAKGTITTSGVGASGGVFTFGQAAGGTFDRATGVGTSAYSGSVRFSGHAGLLDVSIGNPVVRVDNASQGTLLVSVNGGGAIPFATLNLAAATRSTPNNTVSYSGVPAALTSQGASVFALNGSGFYEAGTALDAVSFVIGAPNAVSSIGATVASFKAPNKAAPTPPATTGIQVAQGTELTAGDEVIITATGFQPNEKGILVVIYSTPTVLDTNATADAAGVVTWTGRLPAGLSGLHTLTFQGSVDRGVELNIAEAASTTAAVGCVVDDATLTWGFKESFRAYISGAIAHGEWTVADGATYAVPNFGWSAGTGGYDAETGEGSLAFAGSIAFTGHGGVLNTIVSNPQVRLIDATTGVLLLDISGTTQDGTAIDSKSVEFADLDLTGVIENDEGSVTITAAPATLTDAGSAAFGTYPSGEALDPVTLAFSTAADCAVAEDDEAATVSATADDEIEPVSTTDDLTWIIWAALALLVIVAAVVAVVVVRRRKK